MPRDFLEALGLVILVLYLLGCLGLIDFQLCVRPAGQCTSAK